MVEIVTLTDATAPVTGSMTSDTVHVGFSGKTGRGRGEQENKIISNMFT